MAETALNTNITLWKMVDIPCTKSSCWQSLLFQEELFKKTPATKYDTDCYLHYRTTAYSLWSSLSSHKNSITVWGFSRMVIHKYFSICGRHQGPQIESFFYSQTQALVITTDKAQCCGNWDLRDKTKAALTVEDDHV